MLVHNLSCSDFTLSDVSFFTFSLYSTISFISVSENSSRRWYHLAQNSSSLFPIEVSGSITSPFGIRFMFKQSFKKEICDAYRSSLLWRRSSLIDLSIPSASQYASLLIIVMLLAVLKAVGGGVVVVHHGCWYGSCVSSSHEYIFLVVVLRRRRLCSSQCDLFCRSLVGDFC